VVGVTKALFSIGDCVFDDGCDTAHPCCKFSALQFHAFVDWHVEDGPVTPWKQILLGAQCEYPEF
jgi:hypothetical protein